MTNMTEPQAQDAGVRYVINSAISKFTVMAFAGGLLSAFGHNPVISIPNMTGEANVTDNIEHSSLQLTIQAASLQVANDVSDKDRREIGRLMNEQVLQSDLYPQIIYNCSRVSASKTGEGQYWASLNGELTLHGVTRGLTIPTRISINGETLKASGNFTILQSDYEIAPVSVAGGSLKVKDELKFAFEIVAKKQA